LHHEHIILVEGLTTHMKHCFGSWALVLSIAFPRATIVWERALCHGLWELHASVANSLDPLVHLHPYYMDVMVHCHYIKNYCVLCELAFIKRDIKCCCRDMSKMQDFKVDS